MNSMKLRITRRATELVWGILLLTLLFDPPSAWSMQPQTERDSTKRPNDRTTTPVEPAKSDRQVVEERKARDAARKRGEITFDDLKFEMEKGGTFHEEMLTKEIHELQGKTVRIRGFILPTSVFQKTGIERFVLVRDSKECCFGPGAMLYDCVIIEMAPPKTTTYATRIVTVKGKFEIDVDTYTNEDGHYAVFRMIADEVK